MTTSTALHQELTPMLAMDISNNLIGVSHAKGGGLLGSQKQ